jgi:hypothetical protein
MQLWSDDLRTGDTLMPARRAFLQISLLFALQLGSVSPALSATLVEDAVDNYTNKRFHAAESLFEQAAAQAPSDQRIFLMIGKTREELKDLPGAKEAYNAAFFINPFSPEGNQAKQALLETEGKIQAKAHAPLDDPETMRQAARTIQNQAVALGQRHIDYGNALGQDRLNDNLRGYQGGYLWGGYGANRSRSRYQTNYLTRGEVSNWNVVRKAAFQMDNQTQALRYGTEATKVAIQAQQSANNLVSLLADHSKSSAPHLRASGTNLYVRNYALPEEDELPPADPPLEMKAVQHKFADLPTELHARANKL